MPTFTLLSEAKRLAVIETRDRIPDESHLAELRATIPEDVQLDVLEYRRKEVPIRSLPAFVSTLVQRRWADYCDKKARRKKVEIVDPSKLPDPVDHRHDPASFDTRRQEQEEEFKAKVSAEDFAFMQSYELDDYSVPEMMLTYDLENEKAFWNRYYWIQVKLGLLSPPRRATRNQNPE